MVIISIILLAFILTPYIKRKIFLYDLSKSVEVILYKDVNGNMVVLNENKKNSMNWEKIKKETKGYSINQINGSKVLAVSLREVIEYDYRKNIKKIIYKESDSEYCILNSIYLGKDRIIVAENSIVKYEGRILEYNKEKNIKKIIDNNITLEKYITTNKKGDILYEHFDYKKKWNTEEIVKSTEKRLYNKVKKIYVLREDEIIDIESNNKSNIVSLIDFNSNNCKTYDGKYSFKWEVNITGIFEKKYSYMLMAMNENRKDSIILYETERKHMDNNESLDDFKTDVLLEYLFVF